MRQLLRNNNIHNLWELNLRDILRWCQLTKSGGSIAQVVYMYIYMTDNYRMAKTTKWLQAILDYMKKAELSTSTVFGQFSPIHPLATYLYKQRTYFSHWPLD